MTMYVATRRIAVAGQQFPAGALVSPELFERDIEVAWLARSFIVPQDGWESLDDDLLLEVLEARD